MQCYMTLQETVHKSVRCERIIVHVISTRLDKTVFAQIVLRLKPCFFFSIRVTKAQFGAAKRNVGPVV